MYFVTEIHISYTWPRWSGTPTPFPIFSPRISAIPMTRPDWRWGHVPPCPPRGYATDNRPMTGSVRTEIYSWPLFVFILWHKNFAVALRSGREFGVLSDQSVKYLLLYFTTVAHHLVDDLVNNNPVSANKNDYIKYCQMSMMNSMYCEPVKKRN